MAMTLERVETRNYVPFEIKNERQASEIKRGEIYYADLSPVTGSEQGGVCRPVLVIQNDIGNKYSTTIIIAIISSKNRGSKLPTYVRIDPNESGLPKESTVHLEQIRTIDKSRLLNVSDCVGRLDEYKMKEVNEALMISLGLSR